MEYRRGLLIEIEDEYNIFLFGYIVYIYGIGFIKQRKYFFVMGRVKESFIEEEIFEFVSKDELCDVELEVEQVEFIECLEKEKCEIIFWVQ